MKIIMMYCCVNTAKEKTRCHVDVVFQVFVTWLTIARHFAREMQINSAKFKVNGELIRGGREDWINALKPG